MAATQADVELLRSSLKHLEELQGMFDSAKGEGVDMAKQLIELRCGGTLMPCAEDSKKQEHYIMYCKQLTG